MSPAIEMNEIGKRLGRHWVLSRLNLKVGRGETVALFGRNGSGKSTLLKVLATLLSPSSGSLKILGHDGSREKGEIRKKIRLLAHEKQLYGTLTVLENLRLAASLRGLASLEGEGQVDKLLDRFQLARFRERPVDELSEGMKKRVVLARLLIASRDDEPDLILLDEPHPTLDTEGRRILDGLIQEWRRKGKTIILASHDHEQALLHADRMLTIDSGRIAYDGPPGAQPL